MMEMLSGGERRVPVEELNTSSALAHARSQAAARNLDDMLLVDVDSHHYESEHYGEFLKFMEDPVLRNLTIGGRGKPPHSIQIMR
jgi:hypothetical protein